MNELAAIEFGARVVALATALQAVENWVLRERVSRGGMYAAEVMGESFGPAGRMRTAILHPAAHNALVAASLALAAAILVAPGPLTLGLLALAVALFAIRFRGSVCGGADSMTLMVLIGLAIASLGPGGLAGRVGIAFIAVQVVASYFVAGMAKARHRGWWSGRFLRNFVGGSIRPAGKLLRPLRGPAAGPAGALIVLFELGSPLALCSLTLSLCFVALAVVFHLVNARVLGLSRFTLAWLSAYPALVCAAAW